eukprot:CCRYP_007428-RA/>CCRYP_007428-RA protein AED:0.34 eAED:0.34 QI:0/0/0/1/0/0/4/0/371
MDRYKYMRIKADLMTKSTADTYIWKSGAVTMAFHKQPTNSSKNDLLKKVNNFGIKYQGKQHLEHLISSIKCNYEVTVDDSGSLYCGITLVYLDISLPGYITKQLIKCNHPPPKKNSQHTTQDTLPLDDSPTSHLDKNGIRRIQQMVGSFVYYCRATNPTTPHTLSELSTQHSTAKENTLKRCNHFLNYMWTHPDARIRYYASNMILRVHSNASYLSAKDVKSRAAGIFFRGSFPQDNQPIQLNGTITVLCTTQKFITASAAKAELGALFLNAKEAKIRRLEELGHPQPPTPIHVDNSTTVGIVNNTIKRQKSQSMEMRYFWLLDGHNNKIFDFQYDPGLESLADYPSKAHPGRHHLEARCLLPPSIFTKSC